MGGDAVAIPKYQNGVAARMAQDSMGPNYWYSFSNWKFSILKDRIGLPDCLYYWA